MNRLDRLMIKAKPKPTLQHRLAEDNPYLSMSFEELTDYMSGENYRAPAMGTWEWEQFIWAMMQAYSDGRCLDMEVAYNVEDTVKSIHAAGSAPDTG